MSGETPTIRCGNLIYTRRGLLVIFAWLLWGDFCFTLMEAVVPSILPLKLKELSSPNWTIGLILSTLPGVFNTTICPWVSFKSDRYRSRWGRRIPFILATMPFLAVSLILIGFSDDIGRWLHHSFFAGGTIHQTSVIIVLLAVFAGCFDLFNMFVSSVYWYLFNDVVPTAYLGRFMGWFRTVGALSSGLYYFFVFRFATSHMREIFLGAAVLYVAGFGLMCLRVKERTYPPLDDSGQAPSLRRDIQTFARECYSSRFYWDLFLYTAFVGIGGTITGSFGMFFSFSLGLTPDQFGKLSAISLWVAAAAMVFAGILVDRWNPVRVLAYGTAMGAFLAFNNWIWAFTDPPSANFYFWTALAVLPFGVFSQALNIVAASPRQMLLFPRERYGQFCGAQSLIRSICTMIGGLLAGLFVDGVRLFTTTDQYAYRFLFLWSGAFTVIAFVFHYRGFRVWKRLGGAEGYQPPEGDCRLEALPPRPDGGVRRGLLTVHGLTACGAMAASMAFGVAHWQSGNLHAAGLFGVQLALQATLLAGYIAFIRFMERP